MGHSNHPRRVSFRKNITFRENFQLLGEEINRDNKLTVFILGLLVLYSTKGEG